MDKSELLGIFLDEMEEQIQLLDESILKLEEQGDTPETIQSMFRAAHTLKGSSATMGFDDMKNLTHHMENVLDQIRQNTLPVCGTVIAVLFECLDQLRILRDEIMLYGQTQTDIRVAVEKLEALLHMENTETLLPLSKEGENREQKRLWCKVELSPECPMKVARAHLILRQLETIGMILEVEPPLQGISGDSFDSISYLIATDLLDIKVKEALEKEEDVINVTVSQEGQTTNSKQPIQPVSPIEELRVETKNSPKPSDEGKKAVAQTVRVDIERLEKLMNLVGELVIDQTRIAQVGNILRNRYTSDENVDDLGQISNHFSRVIGELQESVMKARMLPIEQLFNRFPRMIRDLAKTLGKEIRLDMQGKETELDRTVIEEIGDPLIHLIRNAVDHGIEMPDVRVQNGKPASGSLRITARHEENHVILTIEDDGAGIDPQKILDSALRKQLVTMQQAESLTEQEIIHLIFQPGFSTASTLTDISGRGVGMDIVRSHIEKLNGLIDIETELGKGTKFIIKLPLTLAIITGLLVNFNKKTYALPMSSVVEIVRLPEQEIQSIKGQTVAVIREKALPIIWLHDHFNIPRSVRKRKQVFIVVIGVAEKRLGLVVDDLIGNQEIVVKSLGSYIGKIDGISGATILGDGSVALILDVVGVSKLVQGGASKLATLSEVI